MYFPRASGAFTALLTLLTLLTLLPLLPVVLAGCSSAACPQPSISGSVCLGTAYAVDANGHAAATPHHHVPCWTPRENTASIDHRDSSAGSTSGGAADPHSPKMTCTARRGADGSQSVQTSTAQTPPAIGSALMWNGADCSNFTSWVYNFAGLATDQLSMEQCLLPGDLLYVAQKDTVGSGTFAADYKLAHVITWTGTRFSDLQAGADRAKYDLSRMGQPDSRLGGDFLALLGPSDTAANWDSPDTIRG